MDPLIITSNDPKIEPGPRQVSEIIEQSVRAVEAGASVVHLHHVHRPGPPGAYPVLDIEKSVQVIDGIRSRVDAIIQSGITTATNESRIALNHAVRMDMMSITLSDNDRHRARYPTKHRERDEMVELTRHCQELGITPEFEIFHSGAVWNLHYLIREGLVQPPYWINLCMYHQGGTWSPRTPDEIDYRSGILPEGSKWHLVVRTDPQVDPVTSMPTTTDHTRLMTHAILRGGHVRTGREDRPQLRGDQPAETNAELVAIVRQIAELLDRPVATAEQARALLGVGTASTTAGAAGR